jgi:hypothetical protein
LRQRTHALSQDISHEYNATRKVPYSSAKASRSPVIVFDSDNIILTKIASGLDLD